ncbi:MAG: AMP-binding protein, partial [Psychrosphaera sp.]|nr:AMP-binding protein [Psychrosphaera sp.]
HQELPFEQLVDALAIDRDTSRHPIYQVLFALQRFGDKTKGNKLPFEPLSQNITLDIPHDTDTPAKFDLSLMLSDDGEQISGVFNYAVALFDQSTVNRMVDMYQRVLVAMTSNAKTAVGKIDVLAAGQKQTLLNDWNRTAPSYPRDQTFVQLFEAQVALTPDNIALVCEGQSLTYNQLNQKANQFAHSLNVTVNDLVVVHLERSIAMIVSLIAVQKAGAAYVPVVTNYPQARVDFIVEDTKTKLVIDQQIYDHLINSGSTQNPEFVGCASDLAYVIYTSGTTGKPKGVMIEQGVFSAFVKNASQILSNQTINCLSLTQYTFDIFGLEYAAPLLSGGHLVLSNIERAAQDLAQNDINFIQQTPSMWQALLAQFAQVKTDTSHIDIMVGGESGSKALFEQLDNPFKRVIQVYGPTETCIWTTYSIYEGGNDKVIGRPFQGESVYVLADGQPATAQHIAANSPVAALTVVVGHDSRNRVGLAQRL